MKNNASTHYLRVEGVNFDSFLFDTADLSTIRGGSLALLSVGEGAAAPLVELLGAESVQILQTGASSGLYGLTLKDGRKPAEVMQRLRCWQGNHPVLAHATLSWDIVPSEGGFAASLARLLALNRFRQLQAPSLKVPQSGGSPCELDFVRPSECSVPDQNDPKRHFSVSASVKARRDEGRTQRRQFYKTETHMECGEFTNEFSEICTQPPPGCGHLAGKLALVYMDGNSFGAHFKTFARESEEAYSAFGHWIRTRRRDLLRSLLNWMDAQAEPAGWKLNGRRRIEVLLWGGDELLLVVPAWKGWETLAQLGVATANWTYPQGSIPLHHAASLIFTQSKAPIHTLRQLARRLADVPKVRSRNDSLAMVEVLDSFDHVGPDVDRFYAARLPVWLQGPGESHVGEHLVLPLARLGEFEVAVLELKRADFPRRQIHRMAQAVIHSLEAKAWNEVAPDAGKLATQHPALDRLADICGGPVVWLHLAELWDYIALSRTSTPPSR